MKVICRLILRSTEDKTALLEPVANGFGDLFTPEQIFHIFGDEGNVFCPNEAKSLKFNSFYSVEIKPSDFENKRIYPFAASQDAIRKAIKVSDPRKKYLINHPESSSGFSQNDYVNAARRDEEWKKFQDQLRAKSNLSIHLVCPGQIGRGVKTTIDHAFGDPSLERQKYVHLGANGIISGFLQIPTIDYFFGPDASPNKFSILSRICDGSPESQKILARIGDIDAIVFWELNYIDPKVFEALDFTCRIARSNTSFFGGIRVIAVTGAFEFCAEKLNNHQQKQKKSGVSSTPGRAVSVVQLGLESDSAQDTFRIVVNSRNEQLLVKENELTTVYSSPNWEDGNFKQISISSVHTIQNRFFKALEDFNHPYDKGLQNLRDSATDEKTGVQHALEVVATHKQALQINVEKVGQLRTPPFYFWTKYVSEPIEPASQNGESSLKAVEFEDFRFPIESMIQLKVGCRVMFTADDLNQPAKYRKGDLGVVVDINTKLAELRVQLDTDPEEDADEDQEANRQRHPIPVKMHQFVEQSWGPSDPRKLVVRKASNFPVTLGYAISLAKSYGLSFKKISIQPQVLATKEEILTAISRARSLDGVLVVKKRTKIERGAS